MATKKTTKRTTRKKPARVQILLGSESDLPVIEKMKPLLDRFGLPYRIDVASAHRMPAKLHRVVKAAEKEGVEVFIAGAGMAAHLPGVVASLTGKPVIGIPIASGPMAGVDALLSIVQMPPGVPVATVSIDGARNAGLLAMQILGVGDAAFQSKLLAFKQRLTVESRAKNKTLQKA